MPEEQYISHETSILLEQSGWDIFTNKCYTGTGELVNSQKLKNDIVYYAPTQNQVLKWLKEKFNVLVTILNSDCDYKVFYYIMLKKVHHYGTVGEIVSDQIYDKYEDAVEEALKYSLVNYVKEQKRFID